MRKRTTLLILLLLLGNLYIIGANQKNDSMAVFSFEAKAYKNKTVLFNLSTKIRPSIVLDSNGFGTTVIPISKPSFVSFQINDSVFFNMLMEPGYKMRYTINNGITTINGEGSSANNYLLKAHALVRDFSSSAKSIVINKKSPNDFIDLTNLFEIKFKEFHKKYLDSIALPTNITYIIKNSIEATILLEKQSYLLTIDKKLTDSLNLDNKLGLVNNILFNDTILFNTKYVNFLNFLIYNCDQTIGDKLYVKHPEPNVYPILLFTEINRSKYNDKIKEFLLYCNLATLISDFGINPTIENLCEVYYKVYPKSDYSTYIKNSLQKFKVLTQGSVAPDFQAKTTLGKTISLSEFKGKLVFIDVWATWCSPCKEELPYSQKIQQNFKNDKNFVVLYLSIDADTNKWKAYLNKNKWLTGNHFNTNDKAFKELYKVTGVPRYILIDKNGLIVDAFCEKPSKGNLENKIGEILSTNDL